MEGVAIKEENKTIVTVVDSIMGSGKTTWSIDYINKNQSENILYITPFLDEVNRIITNCLGSREFNQPINKGKGKLYALNDLLMCQDDIAATHELFKHLDKDSMEYIKNGHYTLILDEVLNVIEPYNIKKDDLKILKDSGCIRIDEEGFIIWNKDKLEYDTNFNDIKQLAENNSLICINDIVLLWRYPPEIFKLFDKIYVLTYLFEASILKYYFDIYNIQYTKKSISHSNNGYEICDFYYPSTEQFTELIRVYDGNLNNNFHQKETGLSSNWFTAIQNKKSIKQIQNNVYNYLANIVKAKSESILWTTFKKQESKLKGKGYSKRFLSCNCRSTNAYVDAYNLAYLLNVYLHPSVNQFFLQRDSYVNQDLYALSEMLQWIWRSRIRKQESINIYIPSFRMRCLLNNWLNGKITICETLCNENYGENLVS